MLCCSFLACCLVDIFDFRVDDVNGPSGVAVLKLPLKIDFLRAVNAGLFDGAGEAVCSGASGGGFAGFAEVF